MAINMSTISDLAITKLSKSQVTTDILQKCRNSQVKYFTLDVVKDLSKAKLLTCNKSGQTIFSQLGQDQLEALTKDQMKDMYTYFTSQQVGLLTVTKVFEQSTLIRISLAPKLSGAQLNELSMDRLLSVGVLLSDSQLAQLTALQFCGLGILTLSASGKSLYALMKPFQAEGLSVKQIGLLSQLKPSPLTSQHISNISTNLISQLEIKLVHQFAKSFSVKQIGKLTASQICSSVSGTGLVQLLSREQVESVSLEAIAGLDIETLNRETRSPSGYHALINLLTLDQIKGLTDSQINQSFAYGRGLSYNSVQVLSAKVVGGLSVTTLLCRIFRARVDSPMLLETLTPAQMQGMRSVVLDTLASQGMLRYLADIQIQNINLESIGGLTMRALQSVGLSGLSILSILTESQLGRLSEAQVYGAVKTYTPDQIKSLSPAVIRCLGVSTLRAWAPNLSADQICGLRKDQLNGVLSILTEKQVGAVSMDFLMRYPDYLPLFANKLSVDQISRLSTSQLNQVFLKLDFAKMQLLSSDTLSKLSASTMVSQAKLCLLGSTPIGALTADSINKWFKEVGLACLAGQQMQNLSAATVGGLDVNVLRTANSTGYSLLSLLSISQTQGLTANQINGYAAGPGGLNALADLQVQSLSVTTVSGLDSKALFAKNYSGRMVFALLTITQIQALTSSQFNLLLGKPDAFITEAQVANLSASTVSGLEVRLLLTQVSNGRTILSLLTDAQIRGLTADQINKLINTCDVNYITDLQITNLSAQAVGGLTLQTLLARNAGGYTVLQRLSDIQKQYLTANQVNLLVTKIEGALLGEIQYKSLLSEHEIKQLSAQTVGGLTVETLELQSSGTHNILKLLTAPQIEGLTAGQINQLVDQFASLSSTLQSQINFLTMTAAQFSWLKAQTVGLSFLASSSKKHPSLKVEHLSAKAVSGLDIDSLLVKINGKELLSLLSQEQLSSLTTFQIRGVLSYLTLNPALYCVVPVELWFDASITDLARTQIMTPARIHELTAQQMKLFDHQKLSKFTDLQIQSLSLDAVGALSERQLLTANSSNKTILSLLTKYQVPGLTASQINGLTFGLESWQVSLLSANTISALDFNTLLGENAGGKKLAYSISQDQMGAITAFQLNTLASTGRDDDDNEEESNLKNLLDRNQIQHLSLATVRKLSGQALSASARGIAGDTLGDLPILATLIPSQIPEGGLTGFQLDGLNSDVFEVMTREQIALFLSAHAVSNLSVSTLKKECKSGITVFEALSDTQIRGLRVSQFKDLLPSLQVGQLADRVINNLSVGCLLEVVSKLSDSQLYALAPKQITLLLASNSALIAKGDKAAISERSLLAILGNVDDLSFFGGLNLGSQQYAISRLTSAEITQFVPQYVIQSLPVSVLNQMTSDGKLIASVVYKSLSKKQIGELTPDVLGNPVSDGGDSTSILMGLTSSQLSGLTARQIKGLTQSLRTDLFKDSSKVNWLELKTTQEEYEKSVATVWSRATYGQNVSDFGFRILQSTKAVGRQRYRLFDVLKGQPKLNLSAAMNEQLSALRAQVEAFKNGTPGVPRLLISVALVARMLSIVSFTGRWSAKYGYGDVAPNKNGYTSEEVDAINSKASYIPAITTLLTATILFMRADYEKGGDDKALYILLGTGNAIKGVAHTLRAVRLLESTESFALPLAAADLVGLAGGIYGMVLNKVPDDPSLDSVGEMYSFVEGVVNIGGGLASLMAYIAGGVQKTSALVSAAGASEAGVAGVTASEAAGLKMARMTDIIAGLLIIAAAANPLPYENAMKLKEAADDLEDQADEDAAKGSNYNGDYLYAEYLDKIGNQKIVDASVNTALQTASGIAMMTGNPALAGIIGIVAALHSLVTQVAYDEARIELGDKVKQEGIDKSLTLSLKGMNSIAMHEYMKVIPEKLYGMEQLTLIGGQTLSPKAVQLMIDAAEDKGVKGDPGVIAYRDLEPLLKDATVFSMNFANVIKSENKDELLTTAKVFEQTTYFSNGQKLQYADLSIYIKRSTDPYSSSPTTSGISFYSPLALPTSSTRTNYDGDDSAIEFAAYIEDDIVGTYFNLAADDLSLSEFVSIDLSNLMVTSGSLKEYSGSDYYWKYMYNTVLFGNAQHYVHAGLANTYFRHAGRFSGEGSAIIDYRPLEKTGFDASIRMATGSSRIAVYKDLDDSKGDAYYYQENNTAISTAGYGKSSVSVRYLNFLKTENYPLSNQADKIEGDCVNVVIAPEGNNIMSGYNGMALRGGGGRRFIALTAFQIILILDLQRRLLQYILSKGRAFEKMSSEILIVNYRKTIELSSIAY